MPPAITPNERLLPDLQEFSSIPHPIGGENWSISIGGLVDHPLTLTAQQLTAMAGPVFVSTLTRTQQSGCRAIDRHCRMDGRATGDRADHGGREVGGDQARQRGAKTAIPTRSRSNERFPRSRTSSGR